VSVKIYQYVAKKEEFNKPYGLNELMDEIWESEYWVESDNLENSIDYPIISKYVGAHKLKILEAGCGLGQWVNFFSKYGHDTYGIDISRIALEKGKRKYTNLRLVQGDFKKMPFNNNYFDLIISFGAIEHDIDGPKETLREFLRIMKKNGILYCTVPCLNYFRRAGTVRLKEKIRHIQYIRKLTGRKIGEKVFFEYMFLPKEYKKILTDIGFELIGLYPLSPYKGKTYFGAGSLGVKVELALQRYIMK